MEAPTSRPASTGTTTSLAPRKTPQTPNSSTVPTGTAIMGNEKLTSPRSFPRIKSRASKGVVSMRSSV